MIPKACKLLYFATTSSLSTWPVTLTLVVQKIQTKSSANTVFMWKISFKRTCGGNSFSKVVTTSPQRCCNDCSVFNFYTL